jgi:PAS domain S-box-containing protein
VKRGIDTHLMAARQLLLWPAAGGALAQLAAQTLIMPRYFLQRAHDLASAAEAIAKVKIEVALLEDVAPAALPGIVRHLRQADPDLELVLLAESRRLPDLLRVAENAVDCLGKPSFPDELLHRVELARERRYLRRSEARAKGAEARMSAIVRAVPTAVVSIDDDGVVHDWNPAAERIFGCSEVEARGHKLWELIGVPAAAFAARGGGLLLGAKIELQALHHSGRHFPVEMSLAAFPLPERRMLCAIIEDRTHARHLESELRQAQKLEAVGQLAAGLAHEINTPCQFIGDNATYIETALQDLVPLVGRYRELRAAVESSGAAPDLCAGLARAEADADLEFGLAEVPASIVSIKEGVRRVSDIVRAMRSFARTDWDNLGELDVNDILRSILTVAASELNAVAVLEVELGTLPPIVGHGGDLNQALFAIVRNALEAMAPRVQSERKRGRLTVRSRVEDGGVAVAIADTGVGIAAAIRGRIFDPFFTTKDVGRGPGQGLAVAWSVIVEKHRGRLSFETEEGVGTTFHVHLPAAPRALPGTIG